MRRLILCLILIFCQFSTKVEIRSIQTMEKGYYQVVLMDSISKEESIQTIQEISGVESIQYFSKEEELQKMDSYFYDKYHENNPCFSTLRVYAKEDCSSQIQKLSFVLSCSYKGNQDIDFYTKWMNVGLLLIFQFFLIYNIFRTSVFLKIRVMNQLGASKIQLLFQILWPLLVISLVYIIL